MKVHLLLLYKQSYPPESDINFFGNRNPAKIIFTCCDNLQYKGILLCNVNMSAPTISHDLAWMSWWIFFLLGLLKMKTHRAISMCFSISSLMFIQYIDSHARSLFFFLFLCDLGGVDLMPVFKRPRYYYMSAFEYDPINHCHVISKCPVCLYFLWYLVFALWPTPNDVPF